MTHLRNPQIDDAVAVLTSGGILAYPTETVYGLGADPYNPVAADRISALKGREAGKTFLALVASPEMAADLTRSPGPLAEALINAFWPGPLTLLLPAGPHCPRVLVSDDGFVGLRVSPDPICAALVTAFGKPLISTSANRSGDRPCRSAEAVQQSLGASVDFILDDGPRQTQAPSTLLRVDNGGYEIIRHGAITRDQIEGTVSLL